MRVGSAALRIITRRAASDRMLLVAAIITVVLATTLLAAGPIYADAVSVSALRRTIEQAPVAEPNIDIVATVQPESLSLVDGVVRPEIERTLSSVAHVVVEVASSNSYELTQRTSDGPTDGPVDLVVFQYMEGIESRATLVAGQWPSDGTGTPEAAISKQVAANLGLSLGDQLDVTHRRDGSEKRSVIVGIYEINDPSDAFWFGDKAAIDGVTMSSSFTTHGPFMVTKQALIEELTVSNPQFRWRVLVDHDAIAVGDIPRLNRALPRLEDRLNETLDEFFYTGVGPYRGVSVKTQLGPLLAEAERSLAATRSGVVMLAAQLAMVAGVALAFIASLLVESRHVQTNLLRSRGATNAQMVSISFVEGALLTVPAAVAAPTLATAALLGLNHVGPLASVGLALDPKPIRAAYTLAMIAALGCIVFLTLPVFGSARKFQQPAGLKHRQPTRNALQRSGVDLGLLALAAIGFWQLRVHGQALSASIRGRFGVDPLLVAAPSLGLIAGAVLSLRFIPMMARVSEVIASKARGTVPAMSAWQIARRPSRHVLSALLLIVTVAVAVFSVSYSATWTRSQDDQAAFEAGAPVRVTLNLSDQHPLAGLHAQQAVLDLDSVQAVMPVARISGSAADNETILRFIMLDTTKAAEVSLIREDLGQEFVEAMRTVSAERPHLASIPLANNPERLAISLDVTVDPLPEDVELDDGASACFCPSAAVVVQDGDAFLHRIDLGLVPVDVGPQMVETDLLLNLGERVVTPTYPLSLVGIEISSPAPLDHERTATIVFGGVHVDDTSTSAQWRLATTDLSRQSWDLARTPVSQAFRQSSVMAIGDAPDALTLELTTGRTYGTVSPQVVFSLRPTGTIESQIFPAVITEQLGRDLAAEVGQELRFRSLQVPVNNSLIQSTIAAFPTVDPTRGDAVLIDLPTMQIANYQPGRQILQPDEYWLDIAAADTGAVSELLASSPYDASVVVDRTAIADQNKTDPIAVGVIGSLTLGSVAAAVFALAGFAVSATVSARERTSEFATLRAVGLSTRQLGSWLALEQGALVAVSLGLGTVIGLLLSWIALPLVTVTQAGKTPIPDVIVTYPVAAILAVNLAVVVLLGLIVAALTLGLRRLGVARSLRVGP